MKKTIIIAAILAAGSLVSAQDVYKTDFSNKPNNYVRIEASPNAVTIIGHNKNEIVIETKFQQGDNNSKEVPGKEGSERAKGLKPLASTGTDNTGIGLTVEKSDDQFVVKSIKYTQGSYTIWIPDQVNVKILEIKPMLRTKYEITGIKGELNATTLNSEFIIKDVSGPVVMQNTNGSIEISYSNLNDKPSSLASVNGFIDITLPANTKADLKINAINGEAYTDFDIKTGSSSERQSGDRHLHHITQYLPIINLDGQINGGGVPFKVSAINGNVYIRKGK